MRQDRLRSELLGRRPAGRVGVGGTTMSPEAALPQWECPARPAGRPLSVRNGDAEHRKHLTGSRPDVVSSIPCAALTAAGFVPWTAKGICAHHGPGRLTWEWRFGRLRRAAAPQFGRDPTERGLAWRERRARIPEGGAWQFRYSVMAEHGLHPAGAALEALIRLTLQADRGRRARALSSLCRRESCRLNPAPGWGGCAVVKPRGCPTTVEVQ